MASDQSTLYHRQQIGELRSRYCHLVDDGAYSAWADLFTGDARFDVEGREPCRGREEVLAFGTEGLAERYEYTAHFVANPVIEVDDGGEEAEGRWYFYLLYAGTDGERGWKQGRYHDRYERTVDGWKFATVSVTFDAERVTEEPR